MFDPSRRGLHSGTTILAEDPLTVETPAPCWSYAVSFPWTGGDDDLARARMLRIALPVTVHSGRAGVGTVKHGGSQFIEERYVDSAHGRKVVRLQVTDVAELQMLMVRNASPAGPSQVTIEPPTASWMDRRTLAALGSVYHRELSREEASSDTGVVFDDETARSINRARLDFLARLSLPLSGARVLDVGCGVGHFAAFYAAHGSHVVAVDGRRENIAAMAQRFPSIPGYVMDVRDADLSRLGRFDIVHCFGLLYHLDSPVAALRCMAAACEGVLLIETMVCDSARPVMVLVDEVLSSNQALEGLASRPSPSFVAMALDRIGFRHVYGATAAPDHPDFQFEWLDNLDVLRNGRNLRCVFVASRGPFERDGLVPLIVG